MALKSAANALYAILSRTTRVKGVQFPMADAPQVKSASLNMENLHLLPSCQCCKTFTHQPETAKETYKQVICAWKSVIHHLLEKES